MKVGKNRGQAPFFPIPVHYTQTGRSTPRNGEVSETLMSI